MQASLTRPHSSFAEAFLAAAQRGDLVIARCNACSRVCGYTRRICSCGASAFRWEKAAGPAQVVAHATYRRAYSEAFPPPLRVVRVALVEGPRITALWADGDSTPRAGLPVRLHFDAQARLHASPA